MKPNHRRKARVCVIQVLYSWQISKNNIYDIISQFLEEKNIKTIDINYFHESIISIVKNCEYIDKIMQSYLSRALSKVGEIEKSILRLSFYELLKRSDIPYKVSINESIELAKSFGAKDSHKFINGVLDKAAITMKIKKLDKFS